jgi:hypothetical protein
MVINNDDRIRCFSIYDIMFNKKGPPLSIASALRLFHSSPKKERISDEIRNEIKNNVAMFDEIKSKFIKFNDVKGIKIRIEKRQIEIYVLLSLTKYDSKRVRELATLDLEISQNYPNERLYFEYVFDIGVNNSKSVPLDAEDLELILSLIKDINENA